MYDHSHGLFRSLVLAGLWLALAGGPLPAATADLEDPGLELLARRIPVGGALRIVGVPLSDPEAASTLELERFRVFKPGARIVVHSAPGVEVRGADGRAFFRGTVAGDPTSLALVSVSESGGLRGWIAARGQRFAIAPDEGDPRAAPRVRKLDLSADAGDPSADRFCAAGELPEISAISPRPSRVGAGVERQEYAVDIAVDSDWEYYSLFGSVDAATDHAADLIAAASAIYQRDVSTHLQINLLILWTTPDDPWTVTGDLFAALYEFGDYWHTNHADTERTLAHLLSGKPGLTGGIGWGGVLCSPDIFVDGHWAGGYALSGALTSFGPFRDVFIFSHELGHNFDSRHTHCYNDMPLPGDPPIDECYSGDVAGGHVCYVGATSVPPDGGSIMSYCHLQPGGYGNINLWLGRAGSFGIRSERVPEKMLAHVQSVDCLPPVPGIIFADGFESGDTSAW
jgi:hypothetical protein